MNALTTWSWCGPKRKEAASQETTELRITRVYVVLFCHWTYLARIIFRNVRVLCIVRSRQLPVHPYLYPAYLIWLTFSSLYWGAMLQARKSCVRIPMRSLDSFFSSIFFFSPIVALGLTQPLTEMIPGISFRGKAREGSSTSHSSIGLCRLLRR
jgi:hypothetical protein